MRPRNDIEQPMTSPSFDAHDKSEEKIHHSDASETLPTARANTKYESTAAGDIVVVEPSFDETDGRSPRGESKPTVIESRSSPNRETKPNEQKGHTRNLSEHFYDATTLTNDQSGRPVSDYSPAVGQKHRRGFSGDVSNPPEAHRRINSKGNSASVKRQNHRQERSHQRVDSALDILTAAADVSREELAVAAGEKVRGQRNPWDPASTGNTRRSPIKTASYNRNSPDIHPPPLPPPPQPSQRGHHTPYPTPPPQPPGHGHGLPQPHSYYSGPPPPPPPYHHQHHPYPPPYYHQPHPYNRYSSPPQSGYPVQYSRGHHDPYLKVGPGTHHQPPLLDRPRPEPSRVSSAQSLYDHKPPHENTVMTPPPPVSTSHWQGGTTQGVQTLVTTIGVSEGERTIHSTVPHRDRVNNLENIEPQGHHRKTSSLSSLVFVGDSAEPVPRGHHRSLSSSVSFLQGLEVGLEGDAAFLHHLQASTGTSAPGYTIAKQIKETQVQSPQMVSGRESDNVDVKSKLAAGGTSKRVRRKCTIDGCPNRVVQGGLCISHGAKRKQCKHPGCTKNVKKAGLCSTHGPARKRCETEGCTKVAVQGGRCIAHGAKKKMCCIEDCSKQAIMAGMCKKHHDQSQSRLHPPGSSPEQCTVIHNTGLGGRSPFLDKSTKPAKPSHKRGLSIFQEMSADTVGNLLLSANPEEQSSAAGPPVDGRGYPQQYMY